MLSAYGEQLCKALSLEITLIRKTLYVVAAARVTNSSAREGGMANRRTFLPCPDNNEHGPLVLSSECCKMRVVDGTVVGLSLRGSAPLSKSPARRLFFSKQLDRFRAAWWTLLRKPS